MTAVEIRDLRGMQEFRSAEQLQCAVWGDGDTPDPADLMMVIQAEGGLAGGAFLDGRLVGYVFGFPTATPGVQHSHRLAVLPEMRGRGMGAELKWYQRRWCLDRGIGHVRWTFDPMRATNAALNIGRLGARSSTYHVDYYGEMGGINSGLPSDRLLADWDLRSPSVMARVAGGAVSPSPDICLRVPLPADANAMIESAGDRAIAARLALRTVLSTAFEQGCEIVGFDAGARSYLLGRRFSAA
jgi:predicted GNAT superfamily acetyltransferase